MQYEHSVFSSWVPITQSCNLCLRLGKDINKFELEDNQRSFTLCSFCKGVMQNEAVVSYVQNAILPAQNVGKSRQRALKDMSESEIKVS